MIKNKRILITGGRGFIGSALAKKLAPNNDVVCFDISQGDSILDRDTLTDAVVGSQIIIHVAAVLGVSNIHQDAVKTLETNYTGTDNLLQAALISNGVSYTQIERVICFSTSEIFGTNANGVDEHGTPTFPDATDPRWCYAIGKLAAEHLALGYYKQYRLPITIVRPFNVFGEGRTGNHALLNFIQSALKGEDLVVYGDGDQVRAWCHIDDFCDVVMSMLDRDESIGKVFNIGNPANDTTISELANMVKSLCSSNSRIEYQLSPYTDIPARVPDITLARSVLGFNPTVSLVDGLRRTIAWVQESGLWM